MRERATDASVKAANRLVTKNSFSDLVTATDFATWAKAKFSQGEFKDAVRAYAEAVRLSPDDAELRLNYAIALYYEKPHRPIRDIQDQLWAAYNRINRGMNKDLIKRIYTDLMFNLLYDTANAGYERAVKLGEEYVTNSDYPPSSEIWLYLACAYGQKYQALEKASKGTSTELEHLKNRAAECVRKSLILDPGKRQLVESLLKPPKLSWREKLLNRADWDDDLQRFNDPDFRSKAGL